MNYSPNHADSSMKVSSLSSTSVRNGFIRKVYGILSLQLLATLGVAGSIVAADPVQHMSPQALMTVMTISGVVCLFTAIFMTCVPSLTRKAPTNYLLLGFFTLAESAMVGLLASFYTVQSVLLCVGLVALVVVTLTALAWFSETDFTSWLPYVAVFGLCVAFYGITLALFGYAQSTLYSCLVAFLFCVYLVIDTQMILNGSNKQAFAFTIDDYVAAAMALYVDIIGLFIELLKLFGERR